MGLSTHSPPLKVYTSGYLTFDGGWYDKNFFPFEYRPPLFKNQLFYASRIIPNFSFKDDLQEFDFTLKIHTHAKVHTQVPPTHTCV